MTQRTSSVAARSSIVLASGSPRRKEILTAAGIGFTMRAANVPERRLAGESADDYVRRLALEKARAVAQPGEVVLAADTVVVLDEHVLEKPRDAADARRMLGMLAGREHRVITGISILHPGGEIADSEQTSVYFTPLSDTQIADYVATGEPMDKAGAYAIQGLASKFIHRVEGCYFNVVGLPVAKVYGYMCELGKLG
ncbi:MAG: septum formation inhibitor Maf [bacterium]|nr:septum formation inhibitor Maf [bacterium]